MRSTPRFLAAGAVVILLVGALVFFFHLGGWALWDPDEGRHAEVARELYAAPSWHQRLALTSNFTPYRDKPVLFYWLVAAAFAAFGVDELAARLVPALAALVTALATYLWTARRTDVPTGIAAALVLMTSLELVALGHVVTLDMLLTLWVTLGILAVDRFVVQAERSDPPGRASLVPAAAAGALGLLTKGLVAPVLIGGTALAYLAVTRRLALLRRARLGRSAAVFLAITLPWIVAASALYPGYIRELVVFHHVQRFLGVGASPHRQPLLYYVPVLLLGFFPWSPLLPATAAATLTRGRRGDLELGCACWAAVVIGFFSLSSGKLATYVLPALPPLAVLTGRHLTRLARGESTPAERRLTRAGLWVVAALLVVGPMVLAGVGRLVYGGALFGVSLLALPLVVGGVALVWLIRREALAAAAALIGAGAVGGALVFYGVAAPRIGTMLGTRELARAIAAHPEAPVAAYRVRPASLVFYLARPVLETTHPRRIRRLTVEHPLAFVLTTARNEKGVRRAGSWYVWYRSPRRVLYGTRPPEPAGHGGHPGASS